MKRILKIKGGEYEAVFVRERERDPRHGSRGTVTIVMDMSFEQAAGLFFDPGEWSYVRQHEDGNEVVKDFTDYHKALHIKGDMSGTIEVVMGKMTAEEALAELKEVLEE